MKSMTSDRRTARGDSRSTLTRSQPRCGRVETPSRLNHSSLVFPSRRWPSRQRLRRLGRHPQGTKRMAPREITRRRAYVVARNTASRRSTTATAISTERSAVGMSEADAGRSALTGGDRLGDDRDAVVLDGDEPTVDVGGLLATLAVNDDVAGDEDAEQRRVAGQDPELSVDGAGADHGGLAGPHPAVGRDEFDVQRAHDVLRFVLPDRGGPARDGSLAAARRPSVLGVHRNAAERSRAAPSGKAWYRSESR